MERDRRSFAALDDAELVFTMLGLNSEMEGAPEWGTTPTARYVRRMLFTEIMNRWIPSDVCTEAARRLLDEGDDDA